MVLDVIISSFKVDMENFLLKPVINWSQGSQRLLIIRGGSKQHSYNSIFQVPQLIKSSLIQKPCLCFFHCRHVLGVQVHQGEDGQCCDLLW